MNTIDELLASDLEVKLIPVTLEYMQHVYPNIAAKSFATQDTLFPFDNSYVHLATCRLAEIFVGSFENVNPSTNDLQFYVLRESFHWNLVQHTVSRYEPFAEKVGSFHTQLIEAGIWDLWIQLLSERYAKRTSELVTNRLSFDDLISLWFILLSGFTVSGAVLAGEVIVANEGQF